jgi:hypothetical protein
MKGKITIKIVPKNLNPCLNLLHLHTKAPFVGPLISKHELMLKGKKGNE